MKQIAQYQDGRLELQDMPMPTPPPGGALVRVTHSVISIGTEKMKVEQANMNLLQKAKAARTRSEKSLRRHATSAGARHGTRYATGSPPPHRSDTAPQA